MENDAPDKLISSGIRNGLIIGFAASSLVLLVYMIDYTFLVNWSFGLITLIIFMGLIIYFGKQYRDSHSGYLAFSHAYQLSFIMFVAAYLIQVTFNILLHNVIDPELSELLTENSVRQFEKLYRNLGMSRSQIDTQIDLLEQEMPQQFTALGQLKNSWIIVVMSAFFSLITALFVKRNKPLMENV